MSVVFSLRAVFAAGILLGAPVAAQNPGAPAGSLLKEKEPPNDVEFVCPMDKDVRTKEPGRCPRCGMKLVPGIPDSSEYPVYLKLVPRVPRPDKPVRMTFRAVNPNTNATVRKFEIVHEKLFHLFLVSGDLSYFAHEHPTPLPDGTFVFDAKFPQAGPYRVVADFYPAGGTPQMSISTMYVAGQAAPKKPLAADLKAQTGANLKVSLTTEPPQPLAGFKTLMFFQLEPAGSGPFELEPYIGAWGHMLAVSEDLVDMIHTHPFLADGGPKVQFNMIFPREGIYRVWVQFQSKGQVNTVAFNLPVKALR